VSTKMQLAMRLAVCQIVGTCAGVTLGSELSRIWLPGHAEYVLVSPLVDWLALSVIALLFGVPLYCVALLILLSATSPILKYPFVWCVGVPAALLLCASVTFPPARVPGIHWVVLIPLSALFAGIAFYVWLRRSPLSLR
jgi:hypothetical protein